MYNVQCMYACITKYEYLVYTCRLYCHSRPCSLRDNILGHVPVDC